MTGDALTLTAAKALTISTTYYAKWTKVGKTVVTSPLDLTVTTPVIPADSGITWTAGTKTLTLNGATIHTSVAGNAITLPYGATVVVTNINTIKATDENGAAIMANGAVTYDGTGTLNAEAPSNTIYSMGATEFKSGTYNITSTIQNALFASTVNVTVSGATLTYSAAAKPENTSSTITIPVTGCKNYEDYNIVITVTAVAKTPATVTATAATDLTYNGSAQNSYTGNVTVSNDIDAATLVYLYESVPAGTYSSSRTLSRPLLRSKEPP